MKQIVRFLRKTGNAITLRIKGHIPDFLENEEYIAEFKPYKKNRSLQQNAMMWSIIHQLADMTDNDPMDIYIKGLKKVRAKYDFILAVPEAEKELKKAFRAVKALENRNYNGKQMTVFMCFYGSSKFDTAEMTKLVDYFQSLYYDLVEVE